MQCLQHSVVQCFGSRIGIHSEWFSRLVIPCTVSSQLLASCLETLADKAQNNLGQQCCKSRRQQRCCPHSPSEDGILFFGAKHALTPQFMQSFVLLDFRHVHKVDQRHTRLSPWRKEKKKLRRCPDVNRWEAFSNRQLHFMVNSSSLPTLAHFEVERTSSILCTAPSKVTTATESKQCQPNQIALFGGHRVFGIVKKKNLSWLEWVLLPMNGTQ